MDGFAGVCRRTQPLRPIPPANASTPPENAPVLPSFPLSRKWRGVAGNDGGNRVDSRFHGNDRGGNVGVWQGMAG